MYGRLLRRPILRWGASREEAEARLPGDELLEDADGVATRAITIGAPASTIWPWLVQMGPYPRGGAYTYDWIENLLGLNMHSVERVLREYQNPQVGGGFGYGSTKMRYELVEPERVLALHTRRQLGLDPHHRRTPRKDPADQPQPVPTAETKGQDRDDPDGAGLTDHGAQDAAGDQAAR